MNKKAIAILGAIFLLIVGTLGFLVYAKYSNKKTAPPSSAQTDSSGMQANSGANPSSQANLPSGNSPDSGGSGSAKVIKLIDEQVLSPALFYNGNGVTYFNKRGELFQAGLESGGAALELGQKKKLEIEARADISKILWPRKGDNFLAEFATAGKKTWSFFDSSQSAYVDLPDKITAIDWMPQGDKILYIWMDKGVPSLTVSDPDTKNWKVIAKMWEPDDQISISPDGLNILYYEENTATSSNPIYLTTPDGKVWQTLVKEGVNYGVLWSPDGQKFLFGKKDRSQKYQLWLYNLSSGEIRNLNIATTVDKAVWDQDSKVIFAAAPKTGAPGEGILTEDSLVRYDTDASEKKVLDTGGSIIDGRDLFLSLDGKRLFFKNAQDGALYYLNLSQQE